MDVIKTLIADDNSAMRRSLADCIEQIRDIELVGQAADGAEAIFMTKRLKPDVLLLDIVMPRMDGFAVLDELSTMPDAPKVIIISGLLRDDFVERAMRMGAAYYMVKPVDRTTLIKRIREAASRPEEPHEVKHARPAYSTEEQITNLFLSIGIPAHIKGYQYLREAVTMVVDDRMLINRITKELYPGIARRCDTTASKVERSMRHAIEVAWRRGRLDTVNSMYGCRVFTPDDRPTNGEFIAMIADKIETVKSA